MTDDQQAQACAAAFKPLAEMGKDEWTVQPRLDCVIINGGSHFVWPITQGDMGMAIVILPDEDKSKATLKERAELAQRIAATMNALTLAEQPREYSNLDELHIAGLERQLAAMREVLKDVEWAGMVFDRCDERNIPVCPQCNAQMETKKHQPNCTLSAALARAAALGVKP